MNDWPCHVWLQKKLVWPTNNAALGVCYQLLCTNLGDEILCTLSSDNNIHGENSVYQWWTMYASKSKNVLEMHFSVICTSKFTDLANSRKVSFWKKMPVDKSTWIKAYTVKLNSRKKQGKNWQPFVQWGGGGSVM